MRELHNNILEFEVFGESAIFSNPLTMTSGELFSYQVPTFSALQGIVESNYWKPTIVWEPQEVRIMNPIRFESRGKKLPRYFTSGNDLAYCTYLKDVRYQVRAKMLWSNNPAYIDDRNPMKHMESARRWLDRGGKKPIFLGKSECIAYIHPCKFGEEPGYYDNIDTSFGIMVHGQTYPNRAYSKETKDALTTRLFDCNMKNGIVSFPPPAECFVQRFIRKEIVDELI